MGASFFANHLAAPVEVSHPMLKPAAIQFRGYQANLARIAGQKDTLVVLPTGMGKTVVALLVLADALKNGATKLLIMAPTKPLVEQHAQFLKSVLADPWANKVVPLSGNISPAARQKAYDGPGLIVATPQVIQNDMVGRRVDLTSFDWVVYDEAHRAVGDYAYTAIGRNVAKTEVRRLGLTASPGHDIAKIDEVRHNLGLLHAEIRTPEDPDVSEYVQRVDMQWETLPLPPSLAVVSKHLQDALANRVRQLRDLGFLKGVQRKPNRMQLLELQRNLQKAVKGKPDSSPEIYNAMSLQAQAMKILHAIEQVETQGAAAFCQYMEGLRRDAGEKNASKANKVLAADDAMADAYNLAKTGGGDNPKMGRLTVLVDDQLKTNPDSRAIVFTHYRTTCEQVVDELAKLPGVRPVLFVGQGNKRNQAGLSQKQQSEVLEKFVAGTFNVLVATSVAEEGLDIPETDLVVFYEPIPSEIRSIQRRGRTGRKRDGKVVVLMTKGTQDEAAYWSSKRKEQQMLQQLHEMRATLSGRPPKIAQRRLDEHAVPAKASVATNAPAPQAGDGPRIIMDSREQASAVGRHLFELNAQIEQRSLEVGDFILSDRVAVERKATGDFVDSLVDGRLFDQIRNLKTYPRPFLLVEGETLYGHRSVAPEAILGALSSIAVDFGVPVIQTKDALETARFLVATAKREQGREGRKMAIRPGSGPMDDAARQIYLLCGLPGVSDTIASRLLEKFGSVAAVFAASTDDLAQIERLGPQKAAEIRRVLDLTTATVHAETV